MPETNILDASVKLALGGQEYRLSYRAHAFITYAEVCKSDLLQDIRDFGAAYSNIAGEAKINSAQMFATVRNMLWAGMIEHDPQADRIAIGHLFGFAELVSIMTALTEALRLTAPTTETRPTIPPPSESDGRRINGLASGPLSETDAALPLPSSAG